MTSSFLDQMDFTIRFQTQDLWMKSGRMQWQRPMGAILMLIEWHWVVRWKSVRRAFRWRIWIMYLELWFVLVTLSMRYKGITRRFRTKFKMGCLRVIKSRSIWLLNLRLDLRCFSRRSNRISSERTESMFISELQVIITETDRMIWLRIESLIETVTHLHEVSKDLILESIIHLIHDDWTVWITSLRMIHEESSKGINTSFKPRILILLGLHSQNKNWRLKCYLSSEIETAIHQNIWSMLTNRLSNLYKSTVKDQTKASLWPINTSQS